MYRLDDLRSLQTKVQEKAHDLFKAKAGISPLQVTRIFRNSRANELAEKDNIPHFFKDQDVWNSAQVKALRNVRYNVETSLRLPNKHEDLIRCGMETYCIV